MNTPWCIIGGWIGTQSAGSGDRVTFPKNMTDGYVAIASAKQNSTTYVNSQDSVNRNTVMNWSCVIYNRTSDGMTIRGRGTESSNGGCTWVVMGFVV